MGQAGAMQTPSGGDTILFVQFVAYLVAVHLPDGDGHDAGPVFHIAAAVQLYLVYFGQPLQHAAGQLFFMLPDTADTRVQYEFDPFIQAGDAGRIQGPALIAVRQKIRLVQAFGKAPRPPFLQCVQGYPLAHIQAARALRSQQTLVPRKSKQIDMRFTHVDGRVPGRLGGVYHKDHVMLFGQPSQGEQIVNRTRHVGGMGDDQQFCVGPHLHGYVRAVDSPLRVRFEHRKLHAGGFQFFQGAHHRIMLHAGQEHMVAGPQQPLQSQVDGFGAVACEDNPQRVRDAEQPGQVFPAFHYFLAGPHGHPVAASPGVGPVLFAEFDHGPVHSLGLGP
jgi:hypothetical protein